MTPERRKELIDHVKDALGAGQHVRVGVASAIGTVLCGALVVILIGVWVSGAEGSDDIAPIAAITAVLTLVCLGGLVWGVLGARAIAGHELIVALNAEPPTVAEVERLVDDWGVSIRFRLASGAQHRLYLHPAIVDELGAWLHRG